MEEMAEKRTGTMTTLEELKQRAAERRADATYGGAEKEWRAAEADLDAAIAICSADHEAAEMLLTTAHALVDKYKEERDEARALADDATELMGDMANVTFEIAKGQDPGRAVLEPLLKRITVYTEQYQARSWK